MSEEGDNYSAFDHEEFSKWLNEMLKNPLPENAKGVNFNLYEENQQNTYGIQFVATGRFDLNDDDWACDEIFSSGENMYFFYDKNEWEFALKDVENNLKLYLEEGKFSSELKKCDGIGLGFVDGDLIIIYKKED